VHRSAASLGATLTQRGLAVAGGGAAATSDKKDIVEIDLEIRAGVVGLGEA
jgi:hypothetical protein